MISKMTQRNPHNNTIENPYLKNTSIMSQNKASISTQNTMGPQSQMQGGSVKKCKEMGTKLNNKRKNANVSLATSPKRVRTGPFVPEFECRTCKEEIRRKRVGDNRKFKKRHHELCPRRKRVPGDDDTKSENTVTVNNFFETRVKNNNTLPTGEPLTAEKKSELKKNYFIPKGTYGLVNQPTDTSKNPTGIKFASSNIPKAIKPANSQSDPAMQNGGG